MEVYRGYGALTSFAAAVFQFLSRRPNTRETEHRLNRTIKEATAQRYHYHSHDQRRLLLADVLAAWNYALRCKTLDDLTPYDYTCKIWASEPVRFNLNPIRQISGLDI